MEDGVKKRVIIKEVDKKDIEELYKLDPEYKSPNPTEEEVPTELQKKNAFRPRSNDELLKMQELMLKADKESQNLYKKRIIRSKLEEARELVESKKKNKPLPDGVLVEDAKAKAKSKRKILKQQDIARRQAKASPKLPSGDVTKPWTKKFLQVKLVKPDTSAPFTLRKVPNVYER